MHVGIAYLWWRGKRSRRMRTRNFAYLARDPWYHFWKINVILSVGQSYDCPSVAREVTLKNVYKIALYQTTANTNNSTNINAVHISWGILTMYGMYAVWTSQLIPFNSLAPGKFKWNFRYVIFKQILVIDGWSISSEITLIWMSLDFTDDQSTLIEVMAWCRQATSHYLKQCWPRYLPPYAVTRPQWVNESIVQKFHLYCCALSCFQTYWVSLCISVFLPPVQHSYWGGGGGVYISFTLFVHLSVASVSRWIRVCFITSAILIAII